SHLIAAVMKRQPKDSEIHPRVWEALYDPDKSWEDALLRGLEQAVAEQKKSLEAAVGPVWARVLAEGVREVAGFGGFIATELHGFGPQFICACLALEKAANLPATGRLTLMERMMHEKRGQLLGRLSDGEVWSEAGLKALAKLNTTACRRSDYLRLAGYIRQPSTARVLAFAPYLSP